MPPTSSSAAVPSQPSIESTARAALPPEWQHALTGLTVDGTGITVTSNVDLPSSDTAIACVHRAVAVAHGRLLPVTLVVDEGSQRPRRHVPEIRDAADIECGDEVAVNFRPWVVTVSRPTNLDETLQRHIDLDDLTDDIERKWRTYFDGGGKAWWLTLLGLWEDETTTAVLTRTGKPVRGIRRLHPSGRWPTCADCGMLWPCADEMDAVQAYTEAEQQWHIRNRRS